MSTFEIALKQKMKAVVDKRREREKNGNRVHRVIDDATLRTSSISTLSFEFLYTSGILVLVQGEVSKAVRDGDIGRTVANAVRNITLRNVGHTMFVNCSHESNKSKRNEKESRKRILFETSV
jgi:hypothetical protein